MMLGVHTHGMLGLLAAEMGDEETKAGLLAHADSKMNPTWKDGGLFYPRCDDLDTESYVTCVTGNALIAATRLVPKNGLSNLLNNPWNDRELSLPTISNIPYPKVLVTRAISDDSGIQFDLELGSEQSESFEYEVSNLKPGAKYEISIVSSSGTEVRSHAADSAGQLRLPLVISGLVSISILVSDV